MRHLLSKKYTANFTALKRELMTAGRSGDETPHWRAQNVLAHAGLAGLLTKIFVVLGWGPLAALLTIMIGVTWEVVMLFRLPVVYKSHIFKALIDVLAYVGGAYAIAQDRMGGVWFSIAGIFVLALICAIVGQPVEENERQTTLE